MNDLEQIKQILFGNEKKALDSLVRRLERPESRIADVADVLPDAVSKSYNADDRLGKALSQPLESTLSEAIRREPKKFADALFPVMGPAIRKAISEAIKSTLQTINTTIEQKSIGNRYKAWRAGVPLAQYVFQKSVVYRVDEVYLVDPESGRLISYLHHPDVDIKDEDAVSAMLTAIQDFVRDSFAKGTGGGLDSVVIDEYTVLISQGPHAMLACVVRGAPPGELKVEVNGANERIHLRHSPALVDFDGSAGSVPGLDSELEKLLQVKKTETEEADDKALIGWKTKVFLLLLVVGVIGWIANSYIMNSKLKALTKSISEAPGILTTEIERSGLNGIRVEGLRDPLSVDPEQLAEQAGINLAKFDSQFLPFQSLEPAMVEKRAIAVLEPPAGVVLSLNDGVLVATGNAPATYRDRLVSLGPMLGGVNAVDVSTLRLDDGTLLEQLKTVLSPPSTVALTVTDGVVEVSGVAPLSWHNKLKNARTLVPGLVEVKSKALQLEERVRLVTLVATLNDTAVFFTTGATMLPNQESGVVKTAAALREYELLMTKLQLEPSVRVVGEVDGVGDDSLNESLMVRRAREYKDALVSYGVSPAILMIETSTIPQQAIANPDKRRAVIKMSSNN